ncbi:MAG TPA: DUF3443 family protein [Candidatus Acidoferrum sp.]|nr:DUF3443 family protein [Candidatus Acidoferrum sp.]
MKPARLQRLLGLSLAAALAATAGCSGGSSGITTGGGGSGSTTTNMQAFTVNTGPAAASPYVNGAFTSVTVCAPGSTTNCQTIGGILLDTGSSGLRILSSALTISPTQQTRGNGVLIAECLPFVDGFTWGPVQTVDMTIAGEQAKSLPIQVINGSFSTIPNSCSSNGAPENDLSSLGANGILGIGSFPEDCGGGCTESGAGNPGLYYACTGANCEVTTESLSSQLQNPIILFPTDNNGVIFQLDSVSGAQTSVSGSLIFGIGTQSNNGLGSATVYGLDPELGNFTTMFNGQTYSDLAFLDTGSNAIYFLGSNTVNIPTCTDVTFWYCPTTTQNLTATNQAFDGGASGPVDFVVGNADTLTTNENDAAVNGLAGPSSEPSMFAFDWGLPFFFGRKVYTSIEGQNTPAGTGPYVAY